MSKEKKQEVKSPFFVIQDFVSPLFCEDLIDVIGFSTPNEDREGDYVKTIKFSERGNLLIYDKLSDIFPQLEVYYNLKYRGTEPVTFEWFTENTQGEPRCENSVRVKNKWVRHQSRDLTGILFLSEYQNTAQFDSDFEVYGGKLEFPQWGFGFNPKRGTLIVFPSDPHFINITSPIFAGDLVQARIQIAANFPYLFNAADFPGDYRKWF